MAAQDSRTEARVATRDEFRSINRRAIARGFDGMPDRWATEGDPDAVFVGIAGDITDDGLVAVWLRGRVESLGAVETADGGHVDLVRVIDGPDVTSAIVAVTDEQWQPLQRVVMPGVEFKHQAVRHVAEHLAAAPDADLDDDQEEGQTMTSRLTVTLTDPQAVIVREALADELTTQARYAAQDTEKAWAADSSLPLKDSAAKIRRMATIIDVLDGPLGWPFADTGPA